MAAATPSHDIPPTHRALVLHSTRDPYDMTVEVRATPQAGPGSAVVRVLAAAVLTYADRVYSGRKPYPYPTPFVPGSSAIARVVQVGPDASTLRVGQLVYFDCFIVGRDDSQSLFLHGLSAGFNPGSNLLMEGPWRDSTYAEYAKVPLENCFPLDEARLLGKEGLGYTVEDLMYLLTVSVPFGGLRDVDLRVGEKVIVTPATGAFGSAAVVAALAMGGRVVAMGRNIEALRQWIQTEPYRTFAADYKLRVVQNTGNVEVDTAELTKDGPADVFYDISPGAAAKSTHFKACMQALRRGGRVSLQGAHESVPLPTLTLMLNDLTVKGKWMYTKDDVRAMIALVEAGYMKLGDAGGIKTVATFGLERFDAAFEAASKMSGPCLQVVITP